MTFTFHSRELEKVLKIDEVHSLSLEDARRFHVELTVATKGLDDSIDEAIRREADGYLPFDRDWMHKAKKKRRVTVAFAGEVRRRLASLENASSMHTQRARYQDLRYEQLLRILRDEFEPADVEEMDREAKQAAEAEFKGWLSESGHRQMFTP